MKYLLLITAIINFTFSLNTSEGVNNKNATVLSINEKEKVFSIAEQYFDRLEVNANLPKRINLFLNKTALERAEVPESVWLEIKNNVDYADFRTQVLEVISDYYTDSEMQTILDTHASRPYVPITKLAFRKQLMILAKKFVTIDFIATANTILLDNGYNSLDL